MPRKRASSELDLYLEVDVRRVRASIEEALRHAVRSQLLRPGTVLPSSRTLARDLGVGRNTVTEAYGQLVAEGWLTARQGARTVVAATPAEAVPARRRFPVRTRYLYDLRPGRANPAQFPRQEWLAAAKRALLAAPLDALDYGDPLGRRELREALSGYLSRTRGVRVTADQIIVCAGASQGLRLVCQALRARGATTVAMERFGPWLQWDTVRDLGLEVTTMNVDHAGADLQTGADPHVMVLTPAHQFPMGAALAPERRRQAVEWAESHQGILIEDDYDGEFRYDGQPVGALQALCPQRTAYLGTASKTLAPGLRLGWLVLPAELVGQVAQLRTLYDGHGSSLDQLTMADFIETGGYDKHIRRSRLAYRARRNTLVQLLRQHVPATRIAGISAGLHALVHLPDGLSEEEVVHRGAALGLALEGLSTYTEPGSPSAPPALAIGYGTPPDHAYAESLERLRTVLA